jgi:hypothetical protein
MANEGAGGTQGPPTREEIEAFARDWYRMFDEHVPVDEIAPMVVDDGLEYIVPEATLRSRNEFRQWYEGGGDYRGVISLYFDEVHTLARVAVSGSAARPSVEVVVNWQLRRWRPPAPRSEWLGFDVFQTWAVVRSPETGRVVIARYVVNEMRSMPGSPALFP